MRKRGDIDPEFAASAGQVEREAVLQEAIADMKVALRKLDLLGLGLAGVYLSLAIETSEAELPSQPEQSSECARR